MSHSSASSSEESSAFSLHQQEVLSLIQPLGYSSSTCGYCAESKGTRSSRKGGRSYGCWAHSLSCRTYKDLIDQGWRRSGKYLYKPDMRATCCPQYTISVDAEAFNPSKSQRQLLKRFSHFVIDGGREGTVGWGGLASDSPLISSSSTIPPTPSLPSSAPNPSKALKPDSLLSTAVSVNYNPSAQPKIEDDEDNYDFLPSATSRSGRKTKAGAAGQGLAGRVGSFQDGAKGKGKGKPGKGNSLVDLSEMLHECEWDKSTPEKPFKHRFEYVIEPSSFTEEKYELFRRYQTVIHGEPDAKVTRKGFRRFLVDTPLDLEPTPSALYQYGSHHAKYILDGELIAFAVIDVLPGALSSVYFVWHPQWAAMGLGKLSALREAAMVREMRREGLEDMTAYMMGFYIHTCPKMKYKAEYQPSYLLDPETNVFYPWAECKPRLDLDSHASFSRPLPNTTTTSSPSSTIPIPIPTIPAPRSTAASAPLASVTMSDAPDESAESKESEEEPEEEESGTEEEGAEEDVEWPEVPPPGFLDPKALPKEVLRETTVLEGRTLVPLLFSSAWHDAEQARGIGECLAALGDRVAGRVAMWVSG